MSKYRVKREPQGALWCVERKADGYRMGCFSDAAHPGNSIHPHYGKEQAAWGRNRTNSYWKAREFMDILEAGGVARERALRRAGL